MFRPLKYLKQNFTRFRDLMLWRSRMYVAPAPQSVKHNVILRNSLPGAVSIETGTNTGSTSRILSSFSSKVFTLEPSTVLYLIAQKELKKFKNIEVINSTSEAYFSNLLAKIDGSVNFWLDGHYSGGQTYKNDINTPIVFELEIIEKFLKEFKSVVVMIDDVRLFTNSEKLQNGYPSRRYLVDWATKNNLDWNIEFDIFVAKR
jgi:hypothetical protein